VKKKRDWPSIYKRAGKSLEVILMLGKETAKQTELLCRRPVGSLKSGTEWGAAFSARVREGFASGGTTVRDIFPIAHGFSCGTRKCLHTENQL